MNIETRLIPSFSQTCCSSSVYSHILKENIDSLSLYYTLKQTKSIYIIWYSFHDETENKWMSVMIIL